MDPRTVEVLEAMLHTYRSCATYRDRGERTTVLIHGGSRPRRRTSILEFRAAWRRPDRLRFEVADRTVGPPSEWNRMIIVWDASGARSWWTLRGPEQHDDVARALGAAAGISGGLSSLVPALLYGGWADAHEFSKQRLLDSTYLGIEDLRGVLCHRISGTSTQGGPVTLWVTVDSHRLVQKEDHHHHPSGAMQQQMRVRIERMRASGRPAAEIAELEAMLADSPRQIEAFDTESMATWRSEFEVELADHELAYDPPE